MRIEPDALTPDVFADELHDLIEELRERNVDVPLGLSTSIFEALSVAGNPFDERLFRYAVSHLLEGLEPELADVEGGIDLLSQRLYALPANLRTSVDLAAELHEQQTV